MSTTEEADKVLLKRLNSILSRTPQYYSINSYHKDVSAALDEVERVLTSDLAVALKELRETQDKFGDLRRERETVRAYFGVSE